jgi:peptidoglycan/LPS O-acetylase OafA/YrhL
LSLIWATFVAIIGKEEYRAWNSFFMQYLWEFALGMILARFYIKNNNTLSIPSKSILCLVSILGLVLYGLMGFSGGILKLYNDIPALFGYLSLALLLYSFSIGFINKFFSYTSSFSYEWYLIHPLIFSCVLILNNYFFKSNSYPKLALLAILALIASYLLSIVYHKLINQLIKRLK